MTHAPLALSLETTTARLGFSLYDISLPDNPRLIANVIHKPVLKQSDIMIPHIDLLLKKHKRNKRDIRLIAVDIGPGSFTGVRVGVSAARAMAQALQIPLIGVSAMEAMAWSIAKKNLCSFVWTCIPALPGEVYFAGYKCLGRGLAVSLEVAQPPVWKTIAKFGETLKKYISERTSADSTLVIVESWRDDVFQLKKQFPEIRWSPQPVVPHPKAIAEIAIQRIGPKSGPFSYEDVVPLYLQPSWAERTHRAAS